MNWKTLKEEIPSQGKKVLIWRCENKNYKVASYKKFSGETAFWMGYHANVIKADENDKWMEFEYVKKP